MMFRTLGAASAALCLTAMAAAAQVSDDYAALIADAASYEDGAHFAATLSLIARNAEGGAGAVLTAVEGVAPDRVEQARLALGLADAELTPAATAETATAVEAETARGWRWRRPFAVFDETGRYSAWSGRARLGVGWSKGNTERQDYSAGVELNRELDGWGFAGSIDYGYAETDGVLGRDELLAGALLEREFGPRWTGFVNGDFERDRLESFEYSAFTGIGLGYRAFRTEPLSWTLRAAPGVRFVEPVSGEMAADPALELSSDLEWRLRESVTFVSNSSAVLAGFSKASQEFKLISTIAGAWAFEAAYLYQYEFEPLPGFENADSNLSVSLIREF